VRTIDPHEYADFPPEEKYPDLADCENTDPHWCGLEGDEGWACERQPGHTGAHAARSEFTPIPWDDDGKPLRSDLGR
jgi:hypothetical protein